MLSSEKTAGTNSTTKSTRKRRRSSSTTRRSSTSTVSSRTSTSSSKRQRLDTNKSSAGLGEGGGTRFSERRFTGEKPFMCNHCPLTFSSQENKGNYLDV